MPEIIFILPHWMYWGGIVVAPFFLIVAARRLPAHEVNPRLSLGLAYFFLLLGGFMGLHRLYLKNFGAAVFIALFVAIIFCNHEARLSRNEHSIARNDVTVANHQLSRATQDETQTHDLLALQLDVQAKEVREKQLSEQLAGWHRTARIIAALIFGLLLIEAVFLSRLVARTRTRRGEAGKSKTSAPLLGSQAPPLGDNAKHADLFTRIVAKINITTGEFVACWTVIAVFVFYYEVIARYIFNSPTIWAHESMFLMFGMQYLLAGGYCLRENAHVRVDVVYMNMSSRARALADLLTSVFFFIFTVALTVTGWIFFHDSFVIREVSFTEWAIPHWPIKFALPLGGALILLQGVVHLMRDLKAFQQSRTTGHN